MEISRIARRNPLACSTTTASVTIGSSVRPSRRDHQAGLGSSARARGRLSVHEQRCCHEDGPIVVNLSDDKPDCAVVTDRCGCGEGVEKLVIAECVGQRVRPAKAVEDGADVVEDPAQHETATKVLAPAVE